MISLTNIKKRFKDHVVFKDLSLRLPDSGLYLFVGENGCGKSTLLYILEGLDDNYEGVYLFDDKNMKLLSDKEKDLLRREEIGVLFSHGNLFSFLTAEQNRKFNLPSNTLSFTDLPENRSIRGLSGGEELLLALSNELAKNKKAYFLDEVTSSLDKDNLIKVMEALKRKSRDSLIIMATHDQRIMKTEKQIEIKFEMSEFL